MEALSRKAEKEKLTVLEAMLRDATISEDITDENSSISFGSEAPTPIKEHQCTPDTHQDLTTSSITLRSANNWSRMDDYKNTQNKHDMIAMGPGVADETANIYSNSSDTSGELEEEQDEELAWGQESKRRRRREDDARRGSSRHRRRAAERDELVSLRSQLAVTRTQLNQKEVVTRSLQRQLDQRGVIDSRTQAKTEEDLVAALAKASGLQEELARTSQLLVDGALVRQQLEQRCASVAQEAQRMAKRATELENEVAETRAELVRVSGALHARRGTDVVEAERTFGEELQRVQESASREARNLRQEITRLRAMLEETTAKFRKACGERDTWREEAEVLSKETSNLKETVTALRQYSENDTIDQLLGQVSRWKDHAEELERLQRQSPSPFCFYGNSDTTVSQYGGSPSPHPAAQEGFSEESAVNDENVTAKPLSTKVEEGAVVLVERARAEDVLRQELQEAREGLQMAGEESATAVQVAREETFRREAAEARVENLQTEAESSARTARESLAARRATKTRALEDLKMTIRQEMSAELDRLRYELEEHRQVENSPGMDVKSPGIDKSCQVDDMTTQLETTDGKNLESQSEDKSCQVDTSKYTLEGPQHQYSATDDTPCGIVANSGRSLVSETQAAALCAAAEVGARAWAHAFASATQLICTAFASLCEHAPGPADLEDSEGNALMPVFGGAEVGFSTSTDHEHGNSGQPEPEDDVEAEAARALQTLRTKVESAVGDIRLTLAGHATQTATLLARVTTVPTLTTGSQTEKEEDNIKTKITPENQLQVVLLSGAGVNGKEVAEQDTEGAPGGNSAPAWGGERETRKGSDEKGCQCERSCPDVVLVESRQKALREALQQAEREKENLLRSLTAEFKHEKVSELDRQRKFYESQIRELHACTMAIVQEFGGGMTVAPTTVAWNPGARRHPFVA